MSKEQTPITAEEFDRVIRQINAVDTSQDQWDVRKQKIDILKEFTQAKVLEALEEVKTHIEKQPKLYPLSLWAKLSIMKDEATKQK